MRALIYWLAGFPSAARERFAGRLPQNSIASVWGVPAGHKDCIWPLHTNSMVRSQVFLGR